ncbi:MAG: double zinc ribbon domain-containing protein [Nitrospirota bacterium]|nr:double zinc ribbon domain-containing protein [Nitrospirota bacterium]
MFRLLILNIVAAMAGGIIADRKGRNYLVWAVLCFILPVSVFLLVMLPPQIARGRTRKCPHCSRIVSEKETICRFCNRELPINLVQCDACGSFVPEKDYCMQCNKKLRY